MTQPTTTSNFQKSSRTLLGINKIPRKETELIIISLWSSNSASLQHEAQSLSLVTESQTKINGKFSKQWIWTVYFPFKVHPFPSFQPSPTHSLKLPQRIQWIFKTISNRYLKFRSNNLNGKLKMQLKWEKSENKKG